jgi:hypothetical protein
MCGQHNGTDNILASGVEQLQSTQHACCAVLAMARLPVSTTPMPHYQLCNEVLAKVTQTICTQELLDAETFGLLSRWKQLQGNSSLKVDRPDIADVIWSHQRAHKQRVIQ